MSNSPTDAAPSRRGRFVLIALLVLFVGPILVAMVMSRLNLHPSASNSKGELLSPKPDLRAITFARADGGAYAWEPERRLWRIALSPPPGWCESHAAACAKQAQDLDKVWQLLGKNADRAQVLWFGAPPPSPPDSRGWLPMREDARLSAALPRNAASDAGAAAYVIDPYGFVVLRDAPGFDPADLRRDLGKLLRLE